MKNANFGLALAGVFLPVLTAMPAEALTTSQVVIVSYVVPPVDTYKVHATGTTAAGDPFDGSVDLSPRYFSWQLAGIAPNGDIQYKSYALRYGPFWSTDFFAPIPVGEISSTPIILPVSSLTDRFTLDNRNQAGCSGELRS